jgi:hypothetical protein
MINAKPSTFDVNVGLHFIQPNLRHLRASLSLEGRGLGIANDLATVVSVA